MQDDLTVSQLAKEARCHPNTVRNYHKRGLIIALRDRNNWRRFPLTEVVRFQKLLAERTVDGGNNE
jgi:DNA-binding transcriptional MerR regulator